MECAETPLDWMHRATAYELLAQAFLVPGKETIEALVAGDFEAACGEVCTALGCEAGTVNSISTLLSEYCGKDPEQTYHMTRCEHTRLFVGKGDPLITPFIGVWASEQRGVKGLLFVGEESIAIERFMRSCGVAKDTTSVQANIPVDHIGTVCEFLKYLCLVNAQAIQVPLGFGVGRDDYEKFVEAYFVTYAMWCAERVAMLAKSSFYQAAALLLNEMAT